MNPIVDRKKREIYRLKKEIHTIKINTMNQIHNKQKRVLILTQEIEDLRLKT